MVEFERLLVISAVMSYHQMKLLFEIHGPEKDHMPHDG